MIETVKTTKTNKATNTTMMVMTAAFSALIILMAFVPGLGYIPLGVINATTIHIPVIIGAIFLGPKCGAFLGAVFGFTSLINNSFIAPKVTSFVFSPFVSGGGIKSIIICFVPRILIGVVAYYVFVGVKKLLRNMTGSKTIALAVAGVLGSLTNTLLVMNGIYFLFKAEYANAIGKASSALYTFIMGVIGTNGVPEAIVAGILTVALGQALLVVKKNMKF